jgi:hypothetical protein
LITFKHRRIRKASISFLFEERDKWKAYAFSRDSDVIDLAGVTCDCVGSA